MTRAAALGRRLALQGVTVTVAEAGRLNRILDVPNLVVAPGEALGVAGPSGAGKTSLLHAIAGLVAPSSGHVSWGETVTSTLSETARDRWRRETVGLVFQDFALVPELDVLGNILIPATFDHWRTPPDLARRALALAERVGLNASLKRRVALLSRGEQQRVAIARALLRQPALVLADEPSASLDAENGALVADLLIEVVRERGATLIVVSHDELLLGRLDRVIRFAAGRPVEPRMAAA